MIIYIDTSALARAYLEDQEDSKDLNRLFREGVDPVITSELTDVEIASALARASREETISAKTADRLLDAYKADTSDSGPIGVVAVTSQTYALAQQFVSRAAVRCLDAIHLAACDLFAKSAADEVFLLSRDVRQIDAAHGLGVAVYTATPDTSL